MGSFFLIGFIAFALLASGCSRCRIPALPRALARRPWRSHRVFAYVAAAGLLLLALYLPIASVSIYGIAAVFKQSYAAYFFGSHYPELGNRLEPPEEELVGALVTHNIAIHAATAGAAAGLVANLGCPFVGRNVHF